MTHRPFLPVVAVMMMVAAALILLSFSDKPARGGPNLTATPTPVPGIEGNVFVDLNGDGKWNTAKELGLVGVTVSVAGRNTQTAVKGFYKFDALRTNRTCTVQLTPPAGYVGVLTARTVYLASGQRIEDVYLTLLPAETSTPAASPTSTATASVTPTETATATPTETLAPPPTETPTPTAIPTVSPTPTSTVCPQATSELLWVEPVTSPTDLLAQTLVVRIGNGDAVTVTTASGVFTRTGSFGVYGSPALVELTLLPDTTHQLGVAAHVRRVAGWGGCQYGDYTLTTGLDRNGAPLIIRQLMPTATATATATPTATLLPRRRYLPLILR
jgi:hypothetical protein